MPKEELEIILKIKLKSNNKFDIIIIVEEIDYECKYKISKYTTS